MVHIRFDSRSLDVPKDQLGLHFRMTDADIKARVARYLRVAPTRLETYVIDRPSSGAIIVRPEAVYG